MNTKERLKVMDEINEANKRHVEEWKAANGKKGIRGVLIDVENNVAKELTVEKTLQSYYGLLNCRCIDIVSREIGGMRFDIICDDEALLVENIMPSAIAITGEVMLHGNLFVVAFDGKEDVRSLTDDEVAHVLRNAVTCYYVKQNGSKCQSIMLTRVGY